MKQFGLIVVELFSGLSSEIQLRRLNDGIDGASLLAVTAVDALGLIQVVTSSTTRTVGTRSLQEQQISPNSTTTERNTYSLNGDGLGGADGLAELAGNASLLTGRISSQTVLTSHSRRQLVEFVRVVEGELLSSHGDHNGPAATEHIIQEQIVGKSVED